MDKALRFIKWLFKAAIVVFVVLTASEFITDYTGAQRWLAGVVLCVVGFGLYIGNVTLSRSYVISQTLALSPDPANVKAEVVPKWVSFMGFVGVSALIAGEIWFVLYIFDQHNLL